MPASNLTWHVIPLSVYRILFRNIHSSNVAVVLAVVFAAAVVDYFHYHHYQLTTTTMLLSIIQSPMAGTYLIKWNVHWNLIVTNRPSMTTPQSVNPFRIILTTSNRVPPIPLAVIPSMRANNHDTNIFILIFISVLIVFVFSNREKITAKATSSPNKMFTRRRRGGRRKGKKK